MKRVVYARYIHKSAVDEFLSTMGSDTYDTIRGCMNYASSQGWTYDIVKYDTKAETVTLIEAWGWDTRYEPTIGRSYLFDVSDPLNPVYRLASKGGITVYHRKHEFVSPNYTGFDLQQSRNRTDTLEAIPEVHDNKSRIGSLKNWMTLLKKYNLPVYMDETEFKE